ncbi:MAG: hypothetical protein VB015_04520 [Erysipelotrichaceae bacterium]|nr:hypothetical protein [Erysipelotrichaceae bacterium]
MEKLIKKVSLVNEDKLVSEMESFKWKIISRREEKGNAVIEFERDTALPYYKEIVALESKINNLKYPPVWPLYVFFVLSVGLVTALLVMWIVMKDNFNSVLWLLSLGLPATLFSTLSAAYVFYRAKKMEQFFNEESRIKSEIQKELNSLKEKYGE